MPDVTLKAKCNADLRCQHKSGCGCLGKGVTCAHPSAQEEAESSVEAEDRVMARHSPLVDQEGEKEVAQSQRMQMRTPDGESMTVMTSEGVVDVGQDESDPLGLVKAMDEKTGAGKAGARERGDTRSEGVSDHGPYKEDYLGLHPEEDATVHVHEGFNQANDEPSLGVVPEDGVREQEERKADDGGGPLKQISDVESVLAGGVQYPQAQGVGKGLEHADQDMEVLGSDRLPQDHYDDLQKQRGMESVVARYL